MDNVKKEKTFKLKGRVILDEMQVLEKSLVVIRNKRDTAKQKYVEIMEQMERQINVIEGQVMALKYVYDNLERYNEDVEKNDKAFEELKESINNFSNPSINKSSNPQKGENNG